MPPKKKDAKAADPKTPVASKPKPNAKHNTRSTDSSKKERPLNKYSPAGKARRLELTKKTKVAPKAHYIHIKANDPASGVLQGHEGFLIWIEGYPGSVLVNPLYSRDDPTNQPFLLHLEPVGYVFDLMEAGSPAQFYSDYYKRMRPIKCIAIVPFEGDLADGTIVIDAEYCRNHFENTLLPELNSLGDFYEGLAPVWDEVHSYESSQVWSDRLVDRQINLLIRDSFFDLEHGPTNLRQFYRGGLKNIYSFWSVGDVPDHLKQAYDLNADHLLTADFPDEPENPNPAQAQHPNAADNENNVVDDAADADNA